MENSEVLNTDPDAIREAPLMAPDAIADDTVITSQQRNSAPEQTIYGASPVGEKDHATEIATNINKDAYTLRKEVDSSKQPVVATQSTTHGAVTDKAYWESNYQMDDTYKAKADEDYSWNKLAQQQGQYMYNQEASQVLSDYAKSMQEIKEAGATAMDQYFAAKYAANQTEDKMGWNYYSGQHISNDTKRAFLQATTAAKMYSKYELQNYGVESQLAVARDYANANMEALALEYYQDAINQAISEAELTGYYIAPEASEIMKQQDVARQILSDTSGRYSTQDRQRANSVISAGNAYFNKLGFERDPRTGNYLGVITLSRLEYQETVRANQAQERLQAQANQIAEEAVAATRAATAASERLGYRQLELYGKMQRAINAQDASKTWGQKEITINGKKSSVPLYMEDTANGGYTQVALSTSKTKVKELTGTATWGGNTYNVRWTGERWVTQ